MTNISLFLFSVAPVRGPPPSNTGALFRPWSPCSLALVEGGGRRGDCIEERRAAHGRPEGLPCWLLAPALGVVADLAPSKILFCVQIRGRGSAPQLPCGGLQMREWVVLLGSWPSFAVCRVQQAKGLAAHGNQHPSALRPSPSRLARVKCLCVRCWFSKPTCDNVSLNGSIQGTDWRLGANEALVRPRPITSPPFLLIISDDWGACFPAQVGFAGCSPASRVWC